MVNISDDMKQSIITNNWHYQSTGQPFYNYVIFNKSLNQNHIRKTSVLNIKELWAFLHQLLD